jgi:hypothetical protein
MVPGAGLEPAQISPRDFESHGYALFTIKYEYSWLIVA